MHCGVGEHTMSRWQHNFETLNPCMHRADYELCENMIYTMYIGGGGGGGGGTWDPANESADSGSLFCHSFQNVGSSDQIRVFCPICQGPI